MIINELADTGEINQSELSSRTKIPSSTISRALSNDSGRHVLELLTDKEMPAPGITEEPDTLVTTVK